MDSKVHQKFAWTIVLLLIMVCLKITGLFAQEKGKTDKLIQWTKVVDRELIPVSGTEICLVPPPGFVAAKQFLGFIRKDDSAYIRVQEIDTSFSALRVKFLGLRVPNPVGTRVCNGRLLCNPALFIETTTPDNSPKWILLIGLKGECVIVTATCPLSGSNRIRNDLRKSILSVRLQTSKNAGTNIEGLPNRIDLRLVSGEPDDALFGSIEDVLAHRLSEFGIRTFQIVLGSDRRRISVVFPKLERERLSVVKRMLISPDRLVLAIEAIDEELRDPKTGLGPMFDPESFCKGASKKKSMQLYPHPTVWIRPEGPKQVSRFLWVPPHRFRVGNKQDLVGPDRGAIISADSELQITGSMIKSGWWILPQHFSGWGFFLRLIPEFNGRLERKQWQRLGNICMVANERLVLRILKGLPDKLKKNSDYLVSGITLRYMTQPPCASLVSNLIDSGQFRGRSLMICDTNQNGVKSR